MIKKNLTLVILAAGIGSRYGGLKQLDTFSKNEETILDFSIYDALRSGFNKIIFVIRKNFEKEYLTTQLKRNHGNISKTADFIGMERSALHRKLKELGIKGIN